MDNIELKLCREVVRKLRLAYEAEDKHDREIICEELFADVTGKLDKGAQAELRVFKPQVRFYEVLAPFLCTDSTEAHALLAVCRKFWGQPYVVSIFTLLLHQWLLLNPTASREDDLERQRYINVLVSGARHLFLGEVQSCSKHLQPLYNFFVIEVVFHQDQQRLDTLPLQSRTALLSMVAAFLPYYLNDERLKLDDALEQFPSVSHVPNPQNPSTHPEHTPYEGADFLINEVIQTMRLIRTEGGLLRYVLALQGLHDAALSSLRASTRLLLQAELYNLTSPGGPRYAPASVRRAASTTLDTLFPMGQRSRKIVRLLFRLFNVADWLQMWYRITAWWLSIWLSVCAVVLRWIGLLPKRRKQRPHRA